MRLLPALPMPALALALAAAAAGAEPALPDAAVAPPALHAEPVAAYRGPCDASAAAALGADHFVVANDEEDVLRVYRRGRPQAVRQLPLAAFLGGDGETDLEAAAAVGQRIYWIASHGRSAKGKPRPDRQRFFATDIDLSAQPPAMAPAGAPYRRLLDDLAAAPTLARFRLAEAARLAPEAPGGLNIEGLAALPGGGLLIGFRNPVPNGRALLVPLLNPAELVAAGDSATARFGEPVLLNLRGRGVRSIERAGDGSSFWIVAGPTADAGAFSLYRWSGRAGAAPTIARGADFTGLRPEALLEIPGSGGALQVLSDDGGVESGGVACKERPAAEQAFRSVTLRR